MHVLNSRAALLSNYEVLSWLRDLDSEHLLRTKTALRVKKEEESADALLPLAVGTHLEATENLRTIEVEVSRRSLNTAFLNSPRLLVI